MRFVSTQKAQISSINYNSFAYINHLKNQPFSIVTFCYKQKQECANLSFFILKKPHMKHEKYIVKYTITSKFN